MSTDFRAGIHDRLAPLVPFLHEVLERSVSSAETAMTETMQLGPEYRTVRVHAARAKARSIFDEGCPGGWYLNRQQTKNAALHLHHDDFALRFLHSPDVVPAPGTNLARRAWYTNSLLDDEPALFAEPVNLLAVWKADFAAGLVTIRAVHPTSPWDFGGRARIDLSIPLDDEDEFESGGFDPHDAEEDLPIATAMEAGEDDASDASA